MIAAGQLHRRQRAFAAQYRLDQVLRPEWRTAFRDSDAHVLTGSSGSVWFLFDDHRDMVTDRHDELFINDLLFIKG
jgi:hypothetical protein